MKKLLIIVAAGMLVLSFLNVKGQNTNSNSGLSSAYGDLEREYVAQVQGGEMTKEEEERYLKNLSPEMKVKLEEVKKLNKNKYYQLLRETSFSYSWGSLFNQPIAGTGKAYTLLEGAYKERNEQMKKQKELEVDVELCALRYKNADNASQQKIKSELQAALNQLFDIRESQKQDEVKQLQKRLQELQESLQARKQNKSEIVQRRIQELLGDSKYLRWE